MKWLQLVVVLFLSLCVADAMTFEEACGAVNLSIEPGGSASLNYYGFVSEDACKAFGPEFYLSVKGEGMNFDDKRVGTIRPPVPLESCPLFSIPGVGHALYMVSGPYFEGVVQPANLTVRLYSPSSGAECIVQKSINTAPPLDSYRVVPGVKTEFDFYCDAVDFSAGMGMVSEDVAGYRVRLVEGVCNYFKGGTVRYGFGDLSLEEPDALSICPWSVSGSSSEDAPITAGVEVVPAAGQPVCRKSQVIGGSSLDILREYRTCLTENVTACFDEPVLSELEIDYGVPLLVSYSIPGPAFQQSPPQVIISVGDQVVYSKNADSGAVLFRSIGSGNHTLQFFASHPDYLDAEVSDVLVVRPVLSGSIYVTLSPARVSAQAGEPVAFNLTVNNSMNLAQEFSLSSNLESSFPHNVSVDAGQAVSVSGSVSVEELGEHVLNVTVRSGAFVLNPVSTIMVEAERVYNATLVAVQSSVGFDVMVSNTGNQPDWFTLSTCSGNTSFPLEAGASKLVPLGPLTSSCRVCLSSERASDCIDVVPVMVSMKVPSRLNAEPGVPVSFNFSTESTVDGTLLVTTDSELVPAFSCNATCSKELTIVPESVGDFTITFTVSLRKHNLQGEVRMRVAVVKGFSVKEDRLEIDKKVSSIESQLSSLELKGISSPAVQAILDGVKVSSPKTPEDVAELLGELERANKYLAYAKSSDMPEARPLPVTQLVVGASGILVAVGIVYILQHYRSDPYHPVYRSLGVAPQRPPPGRTTPVIENEFKDVKLPNLGGK